MFSALTQSIYYLPGMIAHAVALGIASMLWERHRTAAIWLAAGTAAQLLASGVSWGTYALLWADPSAESISMRSTIQAAMGVLSSLVRAGGEMAVAGAVWVAVRGPSGEVDPPKVGA